MKTAIRGINNANQWGGGGDGVLRRCRSWQSTKANVLQRTTQKHPLIKRREYCGDKSEQGRQLGKNAHNNNAFLEFIIGRGNS